MMQPAFDLQERCPSDGGQGYVPAFSGELATEWSGQRKGPAVTDYPEPTPVLLQRVLDGLRGL